MKKNYDAAFKAKVALEAVRGEKTIAQIASEYWTTQQGWKPSLMAPRRGCSSLWTQRSTARCIEISISLSCCRSPQPGRMKKTMKNIATPAAGSSVEMMAATAARRAAMSYRNFFAFQKEPFPQEIRMEDLYPLPGLKAATERFMFALELGAVSVVTGDVGSGKSTALRYAASKLHPSRYKVVSLVGSTGSVIDIMRRASTPRATATPLPSSPASFVPLSWRPPRGNRRRSS